MTLEFSPSARPRAALRGARKRIVLLHGFLEAPAIWQVQRRALDDAGYVTHAPPLPGHRADALRGPDAVALAQDPDRLVRHMAEGIARRSGGRPVRLVGHSFGGLLALGVARARPDLVSDVCVVGALHAGACGRTQTLSSWIVTESRWLGPPAARWLLGLWVARRDRFDGWMQGSTATGERIVVDTDAMRAELAGADPETLCAFARWIAHCDMLETATDLRTPVTCVIGGRDPVVSAAHQLELARRLPRGVAQVTDSGHLPMLTAPDSMTQTLLAWARVGEIDGAEPLLSPATT